MVDNLNIPSLIIILHLVTEYYHWRHVRTVTKDLFTLDDNDVNFLCHQNWVGWLPLLLFTLDDKNKIIHKHCCQWSPFLIWQRCCQQVWTVHNSCFKKYLGKGFICHAFHKGTTSFHKSVWFWRINFNINTDSRPGILDTVTINQDNKDIVDEGKNENASRQQRKGTIF